MQLSLFPKVKVAPWQEVNGSHLQGYIDISFDELIERLGEPHDENGDKVQAEWALKFEDGTIATIYDYKEFRRVENVTHWHIGGHSRDAVTAIRSLFPNHKVTESKW